MPLEEFSSEAAFRNLRSRSAIWPERGRANRKGLVPWPEIKRTFQFQADDQFFCLGSCFAQHVGAVLSGHGFNVATHAPNPFIDKPEGAPPALIHHGGSNHLIRYNIFAMLNEFRWALDPSCSFSTELFCPEENERFMDPFGHSLWEPHTIETQKGLRDFTLSITKRLKNCRVVIVTLGLVEVWFDKKNNLYTNVQPSKTALRAEPDRYVLRVLDHQDILDGLEAMHAVLSRFGHSDFKMLLTTSPVPLHATFRGQDVFTANCYSKSVQRAALEAFVIKHPNTFYFPSYECVTLGHPDFVWKDDQRHVTEVAVSSIMEHVVKTFASEKPLNPAAMGQLLALGEQWAKFGGMHAINNQRMLAAQVQKLTEELQKVGRPAAA